MSFPPSAVLKRLRILNPPQMGLVDAVKGLETLRDAARSDHQALSRIAEGDVNVEASDEQGEDGEGQEPEEDEEPG